ncbi:MAG TPA: aminotransferase class V-fold PLP-dependent enzyme [Caulobacteraceae bacterium]|nr:aminotransferase class V-fold PLP-dependent enzyme [Caulobacteraceae bacterium]
MRPPVYLDYNATARLRPQAREAALAAMAIGANPSSVHADGRAARMAIEDARAAVANLVGAPRAAVTFVSGGAEANALAIASAVAAGCERILVSAGEHDSVLADAQASGVGVDIWPTRSDGTADLGWLAERLAGPKALVCLMLANNETGVVQPAAEAAALARAAGAWLHVDVVQAAGKIPVSLAALGADTLALSAHKLGGPAGAGALAAAQRARLTPMLRGGGQERGFRAGTENLAGVAGFGAAAGAALAEIGAPADQGAWRDRLARTVQAAGAVVLGEAAPRLNQTLCFATPGFSSELQVMALDLAGVMISAGAACSSGKVRASRVVQAMGRPDLAPFSVRVSGGWASREADWIACGEAWLEAHERWAARARRVA